MPDDPSMGGNGSGSGTGMPPPNNPWPASVRTTGVVKPANVEGPAGAKTENGSMALTRGASVVHPANQAHAHGDRREGTMPLTGHASVVHPSNKEFTVGITDNPKHPSAVAVGRGAIPVQPFRDSGRPSGSMPVSEMPMVRPKGK